MKKHEKKYIEVEGIMRVCYDSFLKTGNKAYSEIIALADAVPTADVKEVRHGRWVKDEFGSRCGACGLYAYRDKFDKPWESPYCPNCGALLRGDEE